MSLPFPFKTALEQHPGWRLIVETLWGQRGGLALGITAGLLWTLGKVSAPVLVRGAIDDGIAADDPSALLRWCIGIAAAAVVAAAFTGLRRYMAFREARRCEATLRDRMFAHIQRLHFSFHDQTQAGQLMSRSNTDLQQIQNFVVLIPLTVSNFATVAVVTVIMLSIHPLLTILALGSLPFVNVLAKRFSQRLHPAVMGIQEESAQLASVVDETVAGVRVVKGFGAESVMNRRLQTEADDVYAMAMQAARVRSQYLPAIELLPNLGLVFVLGYGGHLVLQGSLSIGTLILFNFFVILLINPLRMLGMIIAQAERSSAAADRVAMVLATDPVIVDPAHPTPLPERPDPEAGLGRISFSNVRFGYGAGRDAPVLEDFDLEIQAGESIALVGATGCGKSTIARLLPRFYEPDRGHICLDGIDLRQLSLQELRRQVGIVFEDTFLFSTTVASNIAYGDPEASQESIERAARLAGAHEFITELPGGYGTEIGERGYSLSGGQRQRIAIARAILTDPRILILDDATSSVDPSKEHEIREAMTSVMRNRTTVVIAHRPATIALADRVVLMSDGRIVAEGTHDGLLKQSKAYARVLAASGSTDSEAADDPR